MIYKFQFNYCTIKSFVPGKRSKWLPDFNSTIVRLKGRGGKGNRDGKPNFNSTIVRLKVLKILALCKRYEYFNSTIVRLKAGPGK